ncbi:DUF6105 family protein [Jiella marina]|uniref:DUF6105 family protein n=1 Tax=Jiella sp. LLJ827 TaxID=2917712 RepID=UPI002100E986|nr:DUF6105 family protein [Jiella sp. LLJ827]MCQ0986643.1 DUF6105 family protein [Jiella sp. LLJ827]
MRTLVILWFAPLAFFWGWYYLSLLDVGSQVGGVFLSRQLNDHVFAIYGNLLGMDPAAIPGLIAEAILLDSLLLLAILAFRRRRKIAAWWRERKAAPASVIAPDA